jgi:tRNA(fMet)-specific endonuclease VapC
MIASIALAYNLTLVTNNTKHFKRIPNLCLENWIENQK